MKYLDIKKYYYQGNRFNLVEENMFDNLILAVYIGIAHEQ